MQSQDQLEAIMKASPFFNVPLISVLKSLINILNWALPVSQVYGNDDRMKVFQ